MFIEGDTMYSYGHWFPLVIRREWGFLLNADKRSVSTSQHQGHCRGFATIAVPFSAIDAAGLDPYAFSLVDKSEPRIDTRTYRDDKGETHTVEERRPESAVIRFGKRYFLSGMDSDRYFISELPYAVKTCAEAYDALVPAEVRGKDYVRQGEWFAIPAETIPASLLWSDARGFYRHMERGFVLPHKDSGNPHTATRGLTVNGKRYVSGQVRHPEHRMLHLSTADDPRIFEAYQNTAKGSWSASGRVD